MTKHEKQYCIDRIEGIAYRKIEEIKKKHTIEGKHLKTYEIKDLIFSDNPPPLLSRDRVDDMYNPKLLECYDLSGYESETIANQEEIDRLKDEVLSEKVRLKDEIMLGDSKVALDMIKEFEGC